MVSLHTLWDGASGVWALSSLGYGLPAFEVGNLWSIIAGALVAASLLTYFVILPALLLTGGFTSLWRIRTRVIAFILLVALAIYSAYIWDLTHLAGLVVGIFLGPWLVGKAYGRPTFTFSPTAIRTFSASLLAFSAVSTAIEVLVPTNGTLFNYTPGEAIDPRMSLLSVLFFVFCMLLAYGLYRGRRNAWRVAIVLYAGTMIGSVFDGTSSQTIFDITLSTVALIILFGFAKQFNVRADRSANTRRWRTLLFVGAAIFAIHSLVLWVAIGTHTNYLTAVALTGLQGLAIPVDSVVSANILLHTLLTTTTIAWFSFLMVSIAVIMLSTRRPTATQQQGEYIQLMQEYGSYSLSWMGTWANMIPWINRTKSVALSYRLIGDVAIVLGNPIGIRQVSPTALRQFTQLCVANGWTPVYFAVDEGYKGILGRLGYSAVEIAQDTLIYLKDLSFTGKSWQSVRSAINRADKEGISVKTAAYTDFSDDIKQQLTAIAASWVADKTLPEMGFTLGTLIEARDPEVLMKIAIDETGTVHGMTSWLPIYSEDGEITGYTIDIMQRSLQTTAMQGVIEYLIAQAANDFKNRGLTYISLSAVPLAGNSHSTILDSLLSTLAIRLEPFYGFKSLFRFKQKFNPVHQPLYLCYEDEAELARIAIAIGKAYTNEVSLVKTGIAGLRHKK